MTFKIVSVGWRVWPWVRQTLESIEAQTNEDFDVCIVLDEANTDLKSKEFLFAWCFSHNTRWQWSCLFPENQRGSVRNQFEAIRVLDPADDDIVVWVDLDGDTLAHPEVLNRLESVYSDGTLLTYGNYKPFPYAETCPKAVPFPADIIANNSYRSYMLNGGPCSFNHLRTMKGKIARAVTPQMLQFSDGTWYTAGADYAFMVAGLEMAGARHKCLDEVLLHYRNDNPMADYLAHPEETGKCVQDFLRKQSLERL